LFLYAWKAEWQGYTEAPTLHHHHEHPRE
jgi:hypothetical protein